MKRNHTADVTGSKYLNNYRESVDERGAFECKVSREKEIKLKEFNFKILHGILACNKNLTKWKLKNDDKCDVCSNCQTIQHLLYDCDYVKPIWQMVNSIFNIDVTFSIVLG